MSTSSSTQGNVGNKISWTKKNTATQPVATLDKNSEKEKVEEIKEPISSLEGTYSTDYDLIKADQIVTTYLSWQMKEKPKTCEIQITQLSGKKPATINEYKTIENTKKKLQEEIKKWTSKDWIADYQKICKHLVDEYRRDFAKKNSLVWGKKKTIETPNQSERRLYLIHRYLFLVEEFIRVDVVRQSITDDDCPNCGRNLSDVYQCKDTGLISCPDCGCERQSLMRNHSGGETTTCSKSSYEDRENFYKALQRYQGKQPNKLPPTLFADLDKYFYSYGLPAGSEIRKLSLKEDGTRGDTSEEFMCRSLSETGHADYYEDARMICALYWGWELLNLTTEEEEEIMEDYDVTQSVFIQLPLERKSSLNTQFRLYEHLKLRGWPCAQSNFKIVRTDNIIDFHKDTWKQMVLGAGLTYISD